MLSFKNESLLALNRIPEVLTYFLAKRSIADVIG